MPTKDHVHPDLYREPVEVVMRGDAETGSALPDALDNLAVAPWDYAWMCAEAGAVVAAQRRVTK